MEDYFGYPTHYDAVTGLSKQGCFASRVVGASGDLLAEVEQEAPDEAAWILDFKFNNAYEILNGWKRWQSRDATEFSAGEEGVSFQLFVECPIDNCDYSVSGAIILMAYAFAALMLFAF